MKQVAVESAAQDSPVFREEHRRASELGRRSAAELAKVLKTLQALRSLEAQVSDARRAAYTQFAELAAHTIPAESPLASPAQTVLKALSALHQRGERSDEFSAAVVTEPLQRFLDGEAHSAAEAYKGYQRSASALESLASRCCASRKVDARSAEMDQSLDESRRAHRRTAMASAIAAAAASDRLAVEVGESAALLAVMARSDAQETADALAEVAGAVAQLKASVSSERKAISAQVNAANTAKRKIEEADGTPMTTSEETMVGGGVGSSMDTTLTTATSTLESYLFKQGSSLVKGWQRRYCVISKDGSFFFYKDNSRDGSGPQPSSVVDVVLTTVRPRPDLERRLCFELISPTKTLLLQAESQAMYLRWLSTLESVRTARLEAASKPTSVSTAAPNPSSLATSSSPTVVVTPPTVDGNDDHMALLSALWALQPENKVCADCDAEDPEWISVNLGLLCCIKCSGVHRSMGVSTSKVRSLKLDVVDVEVLLMLSTLGNKNVNNVFEADIPAGRTKPTKDTKEEARAAWIKDKYEAKLFVAHDGSEKAAYTQKLRSALVADDIPQMQCCLAHGADIDATFPPDNETLLHYAVCNRRVLAVAFLVFNNASFDSSGKNRYTALHYAADRDFPEIVASLLKAGATVGKREVSGETPLEIAMRKQHAHTATLLKLATAVQEEVDVEERSSFLASMRDFEKRIKSELFTRDCTVIELIKRTFAAKHFVVATAASIAPQAVPARHGSVSSSALKPKPPSPSASTTHKSSASTTAATPPKPPSSLAPSSPPPSGTTSSTTPKLQRGVPPPPPSSPKPPKPQQH